MPEVNPLMVSVADGVADVRPPEVAETATKPSPAPLQNHLLDGCTVKLPSEGEGMSFRGAIRCL